MSQANDQYAAGDNKKLYFIIGGIVLVLIIAGIFIVRSRSSKSESTPTTESMGMGMPGGGMGGMPAPVSAPATATAAPTAAPTATPATTYTGIGPQPIRQDPFVSLPLPPGMKKAGSKAAQFAAVPILPLPLLSDNGINIAQEDKLTQARRTAGIYWGNDAYGLLQIGDDTYIVRTGDQVAGYTVSGITRDSILLYSSDLKKQIQVPLQGSRSQAPENYGTPPPAELPETAAAPRQGINLPQDEGATAPGVPSWPVD